MAFGWGIMTYTTPNEEEFYNVCAASLLLCSSANWVGMRVQRLSPDLKRKVICIPT